MVEEQEIRAVQAHIKQRPMPQNRTADIGGQLGDNQFAETVMCITGGHKATSSKKISLFYTIQASVTSGF
jgi:hypothetical protein